jgi:penicillin-binding protein 2
VFERRLRIFTGVLIFATLALLSRVFEVQVVAHSYWSKQAIGMLTKPQITETTRGRILDIRGNPLAVDTACTDACVDYRAIVDPPDPVWLKQIVAERLRSRFGSEYRSAKPDQKKAMLADETRQTLADINSMWDTLAELNPQAAGNPNPRGLIEEIRKAIVQSVRARRQWLTARNYQLNQARASAASRLIKWLGGSGDDGLSADNLGAIQDEQEPHVVLPALDSQGCNLLGKHQEDFPGLVLRASTHRMYPMNSVACHLLGNLSHVSAADLEDPRHAALDELRQYQPNDVIGRNGVEALCEPLLRGTRGKIEKRVSDDAIIAQQDFIPGGDVRLSIDANLQDQVQKMLQHVTEIDHKTNTPDTPDGGVSMHAAAVVLDVATNEVRVLASNPGFDLNELQDHYAALNGDTLNEPLRNRATSDAFEPGSTVKPVIGLGGITQGVMQPLGTIECTGYLYLMEIGPDHKPHRIRKTGGRCWVLSENAEYFHQRGMDGSHHPIPSSDPHPTGFLTFADALERSCDIYFETLADRLGPQGVSHWYDQFGLGRITGIGIHEEPGLRPDEWRGNLADPRMNNCYAGMGQGTSRATPLQIANEAATIARGGIWMRPRLLTADSQAALDAAQPPDPGRVDQIDLHLDPEAIRQARIGMINVVSGRAGTGLIDCPQGITVAAKTGTADAAPIWVRIRAANGQIVRQQLPPVARHGTETDTPWYRSTDEEGKGLVHGWYMGYAPAEHPQIAFCVLVEYAGAGGGVSAGPIASQILEACVHAGYLHS